MIITTQKSIDEILTNISPYTDILVVGCDGCTQPPRGIKEADILAQLLELAGKAMDKAFKFKVVTTAKQCDKYVTDIALKEDVGKAKAVLSLSCGIGVQSLAELYPGLPVFPAQNTHFMGAEDREQGKMEVRCGGCGDCLLAVTGGVCPVIRCTKGLLNGACGGAKEDKCELDPERDCAWCLIYERLKKLGKLNVLKDYRQPRDYQLIGWRITT